MIHLRRPICTLLLSSLLGAGLAGCASIKLPKLDFIKFPEFKEETANVPDYPDVAQAKQRPTDVRSDEQWDKAAKRIIDKREGFVVPGSGDVKTDAELAREMKNLGTKVDAYKDDDPK